MKKALVSLILGSLVLVATAADARAQERRVAIFLNLGGMWNTWIVPEYVNLGLQTDIRLTRFLVLSPEIAFWSRGFRYENYYFAPDAVANLTVGRFFAGGGFTVLKYVARFADDGPWMLRPRFDAGYSVRHIKLTAAIVPSRDSAFGVVTVGLGF